MDQPTPEAVVCENPDAEVRRLQNDKLLLELEALRRAGRRERWTVWAPLLSACVAVIGVALTVNQFITQQDKDRRERVEQQRVRDESQIRTDLDQLLNLPKDSSASAGAVLLLQDLVRLAERLPAERARITPVLVNLAQHDADFDNVRDVRLDIAVLKYWPEYSEHLRRNHVDHDFVFYKYFQSFRHLHERNPTYFSTIAFDEKTGYRVSSFADEASYVSFVTLVQGFRLHYDLLDDDAALLRQAAIDRFESGLNNPVLTKQLFGTSGGATRDFWQPRTRNTRSSTTSTGTASRSGRLDSSLVGWRRPERP
jgi:hypothetical protein